MQNELTQPSPLLDTNGKLTQGGWSRKSLLDCNLENARFHRFRIKRDQCFYGIKDDAEERLSNKLDKLSLN